MLADREYVKTELIGELRFLDEVAHSLLGADPRGQIREGGESKFHGGSIA
jgi:hypothetical protein